MKAEIGLENRPVFHSQRRLLLLKSKRFVNVRVFPMRHTRIIASAVSSVLFLVLAPASGMIASAHALVSVQEAPSVEEVADAIIAAVAALGPDATAEQIEAAIVAAIIASGADSATAQTALLVASTSPALSSPAAQAAAASVSGQVATTGVAGVPGGPTGSLPTPPPPPSPGGRGGSDY